MNSRARNNLNSPVSCSITVRLTINQKFYLDHLCSVTGLSYSDLIRSFIDKNYAELKYSDKGDNYENFKNDFNN